MLTYIGIIALACEFALVARALHTRASRSTLADIQAHRSRIVRDLRGVSLNHRSK